ncbi:MAG TPA: NAD(P)/FAD-dependent oxidoreductase [Pyrinomonadaceae bacterium]|nr:NAD(P)/FAD-dependent oxidoreductase [Pyrinomonadaceae bacterium]
MAHADGAEIATRLILCYPRSLVSYSDHDVIIIGGGAAGLFCAIEAGKRGRRVLVLEHSDRIGKKIGISGGGRCNFTNVGTTSENFVSANPHFCKSALSRYSPRDFIDLVEKHNIPYFEKKLGQLFCRESSQQIIDLLLKECSDARVEIRCSCEVRSVQKTEGFLLETNQGRLSSSALVIATGGLSIPMLGASDFGYRIARQFGLSIVEARPALVPFKLVPALLQVLAPLSGISVDAAVQTNGKEFVESVLVTHRGLSGPAILQSSLYWRPEDSIVIDLMPGKNAFELMKERRKSDVELTNALAEHLPRRFAHAWTKLNADSKPLRQFSDAELMSVGSKLHHWQIYPAGTEGFRKAEVTAGGVSTAELSSQSLEARRVPGLYFIGEIVDVTGQLGGYNFQWAWASGWAAGQSV